MQRAENLKTLGDIDVFYSEYKTSPESPSAASIEMFMAVRGWSVYCEVKRMQVHYSILHWSGFESNWSKTDVKHLILDVDRIAFISWTLGYTQLPRLSPGSDMGPSVLTKIPDIISPSQRKSEKTKDQGCHLPCILVQRSLWFHHSPALLACSILECIPILSWCFIMIHTRMAADWFSPYKIFA